MASTTDMDRIPPASTTDEDQGTATLHMAHGTTTHDHAPSRERVRSRVRSPDEGERTIDRFPRLLQRGRHLIAFAFEFLDHAIARDYFVQQGVVRLTFVRCHGVPSFDVGGERAPFKRSLSPIPLVRRGRRASELLARSPGRSLREVLANGRRLLRVEHPSSVLMLGRPREVRAEVRANELTTDVQLVRDRLRTRVLDSRHLSLPSFARLHSLSVAAIGRMCAYALFGFCKRSSERASVIVRALSVRATGRALSDVTTPPSTPVRGESRVGFLRGGAK